MKTTRIALLGGTFDPVHNGHIHVARYIRQKLGFDEVHLVTAYKPPHKQFNVSDARMRHAMVEAACRGEEGVFANSIELDNQYSYTIETVRHLLKHHPAENGPLELAFITNPGDEAILANAQDALARAVARGITDYEQLILGGK